MLYLWMSDNSTYERLDDDASPTITLLTQEGVEKVDEGGEMRHWDSEECEKFISSEVSVIELIDFYKMHHPTTLVG